MNTHYFADSFFYMAILNPRDQCHERVIAKAKLLDGFIVTTDAILLEIADAFCSPSDRERIGYFVRQLWTSSEIKVVELSRDLLQKGLSFFESRSDKEWTLTDCISFVVMEEEGIKEALTGDHHFEQAGFSILFPGEERV